MKVTFLQYLKDYKNTFFLSIKSLFFNAQINFYVLKMDQSGQKIIAAKCNRRFITSKVPKRTNSLDCAYIYSAEGVRWLCSCPQTALPPTRSLIMHWNHFYHLHVAPNVAFILEKEFSTYCSPRPFFSKDSKKYFYNCKCFKLNDHH